MFYVRQNTRVTNQGIGFLGMLTLLFVAAKLFGVIGWSWWLVFLPIWFIPAALAGCGMVWLLVWLSLVAWEAHETKKRRRRHMQMGS
jgi:hypothetical protein